jgi:hypothetical protein
VELVERAKALLSHRTPRTDLSELHLRAMRTLVAELERQKYAVTARPRRRAPGSTQAGSGHRQEAESEHEHEREHESQFKPEPESEARHESEPESEDDSRPEPPRRRGRHVPAAIRRAVFERDHGRCTGAARMRATRASAAGRRRCSSYITRSRSREAARIVWTTSRSAAVPTTRSRPKRTSEGNSSHLSAIRPSTRPRAFTKPDQALWSGRGSGRPAPDKGINRRAAFS